MNTLDILMVVSEALPYSKTGGLGDVGASLPSALARLGHRVTVAVPRYRGNPDGMEVARVPRGAWLASPEIRVIERRHDDGVRFWLVDCPQYFDREDLYGSAAGDFADNDRRFSALCLATLETAARAGVRPSVLHAHDWQSGLAPAYLRYRYARHPVLGGVPSVFTIHNLAYQGVFGREVLPALDLDWECFTGDGLEYWGKASLLKSGINYSSAITTVSRSYAREIQTSDQGFGFEGVLRARAGVLSGIRNGIDTLAWNPESDSLLAASYSVEDLSGKTVVKQALLKRFGLTGDGWTSRPVISMVSRMVDQKGLDLIAAAATELMRLDAVFVILGTGEPRYEVMWRSLAAAHPDRVAVTVGFNEELAHQIEGGADIFLMPSRFEPCGLNQMYSLRYGTVPVVRATGGLDDTVQQVDPATGEGTGFKFGPYTPGAMLGAMREALTWFARPTAWRRIQMAGMRQDNSWGASAREYVQVYEQAMVARSVGHAD